MHTSVRLEDSPIELINITPINPLISKCQIKVCYVGDTPNRNRSIITKETARQMANSLPGSPIVGYFNENKEDYEEHNRIIDISNGKFEIKDTTQPYGFVDLNAKVWFAKYLDDDSVEREYLVTEGYLWTGQFPECQRVIEKGNNQSMELDEKTLNAFWTKEDNGKPKFFIINEAIISKLCILGEDNEPCFEGSSITAPTIQFSLGEDFKEQLFSMMQELKDLLSEGGTKMFNRYAVEIGDALWNALWEYVERTYPGDRTYCSNYRIEGVYEEEGQKFAILQNRVDMKYYRLDFSMNEDDGFSPSESLVEVTKSYTPAEEPQFALEAVEEFEAKYAQAKEEEEKDSSDEEKCPECGKPVSECECKKDDPKKYNLEEVVEYTELKGQYDELEVKYNSLNEEHEALKTELESLKNFKLEVEKKDKQAMIDQFYMLSEEDKKDVIDNIDKYSLHDIEAQLSIICVRNKVNFNLEDEAETNKVPTTYNLNDGAGEDTSTPAWVKAAMKVAKSMN